MSKKKIALPIPGPGRNTLYRPEYPDQARKLSLLGATDEELADFFEVAISTIYEWKKVHIPFSEAIREGKVKADANVADSLYRRATGEHVEIEKLVKRDDGTYEAMRVMQYVPGDPSAAFRWLLNRRPKDWRDKREIEHSGEMSLVSKEQRDAAVAAALRGDD